ncbi:uncharacterized protein LOC112680884 [Sipha flava]|uniref:Uncharacterized protein LOC112680884 n=1 Tax=Sipha flava TaxID=143950 RepID=A0A8B8F951_9HEMI|nr:uncharacterized protein LOC112680884 [Sipha flava]
MVDNVILVEPVTEAVASQLPAVDSLKELIIPPEFTTTLVGKPFLLYDSYSQNQEIPRILIFSTTENLDMMEQAAINTVKKVFPQTEINGCFFHFCQSIWRHIQNTGFAVKYHENSDFALNIKMLNALAYVPPESVITAFEDLLQTDFYKEHETILTPLLDYFEDTWIGRISRNRQRRSPKFSIKLWNCYGLIKNDIPRTNNAIEG